MTLHLWVFRVVRVADICKFWYTSTLFRPVKVHKETWFRNKIAISHSQCLKVHWHKKVPHHGYWRCWLISGLVSFPDPLAFESEAENLSISGPGPGLVLVPSPGTVSWYSKGAFPISHTWYIHIARGAKTQNFPGSNFLRAKTFWTKCAKPFLTTSLKSALLPLTTLPKNA